MSSFFTNRGVSNFGHNTTVSGARRALRRASVLLFSVCVICAILASATSSVWAGASPVAMDDYGHSPINGSVEIDILWNDYGIEHYVLDPDTVDIVTDPSNGSVYVDYVWGYTLYLPDTDYEGTDLFRYTVQDLYGNVSNAADVDIDVCDGGYTYP